MVRQLPDALRNELDESSGLDLANQDLHGYSFDGVNIRNTRLSRANLADASFRTANISGAQFLHAIITRGIFDGARIHKAEFDHAVLTAASFADTKITRTGFQGADLTQVKFTCASLLATWFSKARLNDASLQDAVLKRVSFSNQDLDSLDVTGARFDDVWFNGVTGLEEMRADWILVGDEQFHERLEGSQARDWLRRATQFHTSAAVRWSEAGQDWRREPELVDSGQRTIEGLLATRAQAPFAGQRLTRAAVEWLIARAAAIHQSLDLRGADLRGVDLEGLPLHGLLGGLAPDQWRIASPEERERLVIRLDAASLIGANLEDAVLVGAHITGASLSGRFDRVNLSHATLTNAKVAPVSAQDAVFDEVSGDGINAFMANLRGSSWRNASLVGARFDYSKLDGADFTGADLRDATFEGASTEGTRFSQIAG